MAVEVIIAGPSGSGKTPLMEFLVQSLTDRGHRVGCVKFCAGGFDLDQRGKDSERMARSGAVEVVLASPRGTALFSSLPSCRFHQAASRLSKDLLDIVLAEGFKHEGSVPLIWVACQGEKPPAGANLLHRMISPYDKSDQDEVLRKIVALLEVS